jgi:hypothetical protein
VQQASRARLALDGSGHRLQVAALDYGIEEAKRDWPTLIEAVDAKVEEQKKFVAWWKGAVQRAGGDRQTQKHSPSTRLMLAEAEDLTGMRQQRVSDLTKKLSKPDKYREFLLGTEFRAAYLGGMPRTFPNNSGEHHSPSPSLRSTVLFDTEKTEPI